MTAVDNLLPPMHQLAIATEEGGKATEGPSTKPIIIEMTTVTALPAMQQLAAATEEAPKPQVENDGYLSGFDFANRRVIHLRNEWANYVSACHGTPP
jgi:hypothetical protein